ncbi:MAG: hypothetical protein HYZ58_07530 [Acidobacteria bacterium]|nr:hypothetical protein [Acidobacteriota bacterium]MBI3262987.1 hypothetical protein [Acidobacteriota bacterium]
MTRSVWIGVVTIAVLAGSRSVAAQTLDETRVLVSVNGGFQPTRNDFSQTLPFTINVEQGSSATSYDLPGAPLADVGFNLRIASRFGAGIAGGGAALKGHGAVTARIPHPLYFDKARDVTGTSGNLDRTEASVHAQGAYWWPASDRLLIILSGGPSLFIVNQEFTTTVHYSEQYPFDTATFTSVDVERKNARRVGFNAGVDLTYRLSRRFGVGAIVRYSRAKVEFNKGQESKVSVNAGGVQAGGGIRLLF